MAELPPQLQRVIDSTKGFMPLDEGQALLNAALRVTVAGPFLEIGSYCGKSSVYLGFAAQQLNTIHFCLDHHRGSEENQAGWEHHDPDLVDAATGRIDTLPLFRRTIERANLESDVVALVGHSTVIARCWQTPIAFLFIDGGHGVEPAHNDYLAWTPKVAPGGILAIHDVHEHPADGGQAPFEQIYSPAIASRLFVEESYCGGLRILRRVAPNP